MIYVIAVPLALFMINSGGVRTTADTKMYLDAWQVIEGGSIDQWRTPVYPAFLGAIEAAFGELKIETIRDGNDIYDVIVSGPESSTATGHAVVVLQYVALMFAIFYFYKVAERLARSAVACVGVDAGVYAGGDGIGLQPCAALRGAVGLRHRVFG